MIKLSQPVKGKLEYAPNGIISQKFGGCASPELCTFYKSLGLNGHNGIDFYGGRGTSIYASHDGKVMFAKDTTPNTAGKMIKLQGDGFYTLYMHNEELLVSVGESVSVGQEIAKMGNSGSSSQLYMAVHCHFGLYEGDNGNTLNINNGYGGAIDSLPFLAETNMLLKIVGDKGSGRQYLQGTDGKLRWIFNEQMLNSLSESGIINKFEVTWVDSLDGYDIDSPWCVIKDR